MFDDSICITLCVNPTNTFNRCKTHNSGMICCENDSSPDFYRPDGISRHTIIRTRKVKYHTSRSLARNYRLINGYRRNNMEQTKQNCMFFYTNAGYIQKKYRKLFTCMFVRLAHHILGMHTIKKHEPALIIVANA